MIHTQKCLDCQETKELNCFGLNNSKEKTPKARCKDCLGKRNKLKLENKELRKDNKKRCFICNEIKLLSEFGTRGLTFCTACECEKYRESQRISKKRRMSQILITNRKWRKRNPERLMLVSARQRAKAGNFQFNLELSDVIIPEFCPVFGTKLEVGEKAKHDNSPSLDKINPNLGYVKGNVKVISHRANAIKSNGSAEEHEKIAQYIRSNSIDANN